MHRVVVHVEKGHGKLKQAACCHAMAEAQQLHTIVWWRGGSSSSGGGGGGGCAGRRAAGRWGGGSWSKTRDLAVNM